MSAIAKKLGLKPGMSAMIVQAPKGYLDLIQPLPDGVEVSETKDGTHPFVQFFTLRKAELTKAAPGL